MTGRVLFELAPISYGRIINEVTTVTLGSLLLDRLPKSKPFTPLFSCKPAARGLPATYDLFSNARKTAQPRLASTYWQLITSAENKLICLVLY